MYPGFLHYSTENLVVWHRQYTSRFSAIVIPLMLAQLGISAYQVIILTNVDTLLSFVVIIFIWISTFLQFVPIHSNISKGRVSDKMLKGLVKKNWLRTALWTLLFLYAFFNSTIQL